MKKTVFAFGRLHPAVCLFYFAPVFLFCFLYQNPVVLGCILISGLLYKWRIKGVRSALRAVFLALPAAVFLLLINPLFNHTGVTPLFYFNDMPFTLEAVLYGGVTALTLIDTILWFSILNDVVDNDKIIYLFGRAFPAAALLVGMIFRITAQLTRELQNIRSAQRGLGIQIENGTLKNRLRAAKELFLCLTGNALEHSVDTAMSMRCRGYGLPGNSRSRQYRFHRRDGVMLLVILAVLLPLCPLLFWGGLAFRILPSVSPLLWGWKEIAAYALLALYYNLPLLYQGKEVLRWRYMNSRMSASPMRKEAVRY